MKVQENQVGLKLIRTHHVLLVLMMWIYPEIT
jgi:hypothetical protein